MREEALHSALCLHHEHLDSDPDVKCAYTANKKGVHVKLCHCLTFASGSTVEYSTGQKRVFIHLSLQQTSAKCLHAEYWRCNNE